MVVTEMKRNMFCVFIFVIGMLSVSIANVFGGYYSFVAVLEAVLLTMYTYQLLDKQEKIKSNLFNLIASGLITLFGVMFFVVNDIFNVPVYIKNDFNFWSICVIISQIFSLTAICYVSICLVIDSTKERIEVVIEQEENHNMSTDKVEEIINTSIELESVVNNSIKVEDVVSDSVENPIEEILQENEKIESNIKEQIKSISEKNIEVEVPYMEEEK